MLQRPCRGTPTRRVPRHQGGSPRHRSDDPLRDGPRIFPPAVRCASWLPRRGRLRRCASHTGFRRFASHPPYQAPIARARLSHARHVAQSVPPGSPSVHWWLRARNQRSTGVEGRLEGVAAVSFEPARRGTLSANGALAGSPPRDRRGGAERRPSRGRGHKRRVHDMLTREQVQSYRRDGYLLVENVLSAKELATLRQVTDELVAASHGGRSPARRTGAWSTPHCPSSRSPPAPRRPPGCGSKARRCRLAVPPARTRARRAPGARAPRGHTPGLRLSREGVTP